MTDSSKHEIIVRAGSGMQLSEGYIQPGLFHCSGFLPALPPCPGHNLEDVRARLEQAAKDYYGDDVIIEFIRDHAWAS